VLCLIAVTDINCYLTIFSMHTTLCKVEGTSRKTGLPRVLTS